MADCVEGLKLGWGGPSMGTLYVAYRYSICLYDSHFGYQRVIS